MIRSQIITEISSSPLLMRETALKEVELIIANMQNGNKAGHNASSKIISTLKHKIYSQQANLICCDEVDDDNDPFSSYAENTVIIIPIIGCMFKYNTIDRNEWKYVTGMDTIANLIRKADASPNISGTILLSNTPGGTTQSIYQLEDALRNRTKPCIGLVDGQCCSAGIYALSFCDKIFATNRMCEIGSIGTFAKIMDDSKQDEMLGIKIISVYPPESSYKNLAIREALDGNPQKIIDESLSPFATHFQNIIKTNRPKLDQSAEGILEGRVFYAYDAITYKLIDGLKNMTQTVELVLSMVQQQKDIYSQFKK